MEAVTRRSMLARMKGAAMLDIATYEEVEHDTKATDQAATVVALAAVAAGIGMANQGAGGIMAGVFGSLLGWLVWAGITYLIGDKLLGGTATWGELLRTVGFAQSPNVLLVLGIIPGVGRVLQVVISIWVLIAGIIGIRQALDFGTGKAVLTAVLGWLVVAIPMAILASRGADVMLR